MRTKIAGLADEVPFQQFVGELVDDGVWARSQKPFTHRRGQTIFAVAPGRVAYPDQTVEKVLRRPCIGAAIASDHLRGLFRLAQRLEKSDLGGDHDRARGREGDLRVEERAWCQVCHERNALHEIFGLRCEFHDRTPIRTEPTLQPT